MPVLKAQVVPKNSGAAFEVKKGQRLRIAGKSIVDFVAFNLHDLRHRSTGTLDGRTVKKLQQDCFEEFHGYHEIYVLDNRFYWV